MTDANIPAGAADRPPPPSPPLTPKAPPPKPASADRRGIPAGIGALVVGALAATLVTFAIIAMRDPVPPTRYVAREQATPPAASWQDPLTERLARCRTETDDIDGSCQAAWDAHRRRFFGKARRPIADQPNAPPSSATRER